MGRARKEWLEWFRVDRDLYEHPKIVGLAAFAGWTRDKAVGRLVRLWSWVARHAPDGELDPFSLEQLDNYMIDHEALFHHMSSEAGCCSCCGEGRTSASDYAKYGRRLAPFFCVGLLDYREEDGSASVHNWRNYNGFALEERERDRDRKSRTAMNAGGIPGEFPRNSGGIPTDSHRNGDGDGTDTETEQKNQENQKTSPRATHAAPMGPAFVKPTLEEIAAYCRERRNTVDPQAWLDHYTANGWRVGRSPMRDWRAAVRTWERNVGFTANGTGRQHSGKLSAADIQRFRIAQGES